MQKDPHLCRHIARILQDLSRVETDERLLVAARDYATAEPAAGARTCTGDTARWRVLDLRYTTETTVSSCLHPPTTTIQHTHARTWM